MPLYGLQVLLKFVLSSRQDILVLDQGRNRATQDSGEVQNEVRDVKVQRQGEPRRRQHVVDRLRAEEVDSGRRGKDNRAREESSELGFLYFASWLVSFKNRNRWHGGASMDIE